MNGPFKPHDFILKTIFSKRGDLPLPSELPFVEPGNYIYSGKGMVLQGPLSINYELCCFGL